MKLRISLLSALLVLTAFVSRGRVPLGRVVVSNPLPELREEMVEFELAGLPHSFVITDPDGQEVPWQRTYDGKTVFPVAIGPEAVKTYTLSEGVAAPVDDIALAAFHPEREDDMAWENDFAAYRAYGPAFGKSGGKASGYDVFTKSTSRPVVEERYFNELVRKVSYHVDHGDGMDVYDVGPTLGGGATAVVGRDGTLVLPGAFSEWRVLDNGPLRATVELVYEYGGGRERRLISLDAGEAFNRTESVFTGFDSDSVAVGIALHAPAEDDWVVGEDWIAYCDPTTSPGGRGVGRIFIGAVNLTPGSSNRRLAFAAKKGKAVGHLVSVSPMSEDKVFRYWWGSSWNKGRVLTFDRWKELTAAKARRLRQPLRVEVRGER